MLVRDDQGFVALKTLITGGVDFKKKDTKLQIQGWLYNLINQEVKVRELLEIQANLDYLVSSRRAWVMPQAWGQSGKHSETQSLK